ncbi:DUF4232 domain-containing protein [Saccharopolyspora erythraea]|uniref:DUF4232 domain-containing protein n=1 Tax=Saccharopolyspora erythraea TaxID=1836 RepID=UPI001BA9075B|nr:DUF4232 domain-containing protein [Saccharopolyspora erythraea]QUH04996.1 DUF4232 domain-containing protein [Saccharopolyspora erythraea]
MRKTAFYLTTTAAAAAMALAGAAGAALASAPAAPAQPAPCAAEEVAADLNAQPGGGKAMLVLTNIGNRACTVEGAPGVGFRAADNSELPVSVEAVPQPGPGRPIELLPGRSAFGGIKWTPCDKADPVCWVATTVEITSPGAAAPVVADFHGANGGDERVTELPLSAAQVGTLQPVSDGVVAW